MTPVHTHTVAEPSLWLMGKPNPFTVIRYVYVVIPGTRKYLSICEVEVYSVRQVSSGVTGDYGFI